MHRFSPDEHDEHAIPARAAAVLSDLLANPDLYYVNEHSPAFPGGAIRGQLR